MLALTGCRLAELNTMREEHLRGNIIFWQPGKNQKGWRREALPEWYLRELREYMDNFLSAEPILLEQRRVTDFFPLPRIRHYA